MPTVLKRPDAELDLFFIWERVSLDNPNRADHVLDFLEEKFDLLATQPLMGRERPELTPSRLRSFVAGRYIVFYLPLADGINIVRVLDGRQDIRREFS